MLKGCKSAKFHCEPWFIIFTYLWQAYLDAYGGSALNEWKQRVREHDMSAARWLWLCTDPVAALTNVCHAHMILCSLLGFIL